MFHTNPETGEVSRCKATKGRCRFGSIDEHSTTAEGARSAYESRMKTDYLVRSINLMDAKKAVEEFRETELGGEFRRNFTISDDGETFAGLVMDGFTLRGIRYSKGDSVTFDRHQNVVGVNLPIQRSSSNLEGSSKGDLEQAVDEAKTMIPGPGLTKESYEALPTGTVFIQVHYESGDQRLYTKLADGRATEAEGVKTNYDLKRSVGIPESALFARGSRGYHLAESPFENRFAHSQLKQALKDSDNSVEEIASRLHEAWREERNYEPRIKRLEDGSEIDIAGVGYSELPEAWQRENRAAAASALKTIRTGVANHWSRDQFGDSIHRSWLERNGEWAPDEQKLPYKDLSEEEQLKDLAVLEAAAAVIGSHPKS